MTKVNDKPASERDFCSGVSDEELDMYEIRDGLMIVGTSEAKRFLRYMKRDIQRGRFNARRYYGRYVEAGGNGQLMDERVSFLCRKRYKNERGER